MNTKQRQKKKERAKVIAVLIFFVMTLTGISIHRFMMEKPYDWVGFHAETQGVVTAKSSKEFKHRGFRSKSYTTNAYFVTVTFNVNGEDIVSKVPTRASVYHLKNRKDPITVWYDPEAPHHSHAFKTDIMDDKNTPMAVSLVSIAPFTAVFAWFIYILLILRISRER